MKIFTLKKNNLLLLALAILFVSCEKKYSRSEIINKHIIQFVYTSDNHFGIKRKEFRGDTNVDSKTVNEALVAQINAISSQTLPQDKGVMAGKIVGAIDFLINTGDITTRAEPGNSSAIDAWNDYVSTFSKITLKRADGTDSKQLICPGNHDVSNSIGHKRIAPENVDATIMANIYNYVYKPAVPKTKETYNYDKDKIHYIESYKGVNFAFINMWPDTKERDWLSRQIKDKNLSAPILIFTHDEAAVEFKHIMDTNSDPANNKYVFSNYFENCVNEIQPVGTNSYSSSDDIQKGFTSFIAANNRIKAYFHGNTNYNEFYTYTGVPEGSISLPVFRVDSSMKGEYSASDESKLSFQLVTIDTKTKQMTVRECLWNTTKSASDKIVWGESKTISIE